MRFSTFQYLKELNIKFTGKFRLTDESFKSDLPTETLLKLNINTDGLESSSIETNALSYAYRPIHVAFEQPENIGKQQCRSLALEEEIFAPFLAVNPDNKIRVQSCPIACDCSIKWLFDAPKDWWMRVEAGDSNIGLQCDDQRSLYFYSDYDFRSCPKSNLLKYFVPDHTGKIDSGAAASPPVSSTYAGGNEAVQASKPVVSQESKAETSAQLPAEPVPVVAVVEPKVEATKPVEVKETVSVGEAKSQNVPAPLPAKDSKKIKP